MIRKGKEALMRRVSVQGVGSREGQPNEVRADLQDLGRRRRGEGWGDRKEQTEERGEEKIYA